MPTRGHSGNNLLLIRLSFGVLLGLLLLGSFGAAQRTSHWLSMCQNVLTIREGILTIREGVLTIREGTAAN